MISKIFAYICITNGSLTHLKKHGCQAYTVDSNVISITDF